MVNQGLIGAIKKRLSWKKAAKLLIQPQVITLFFLGLSAGIPLLLIFSSLSLWLNEAGVSKAVVTYFSWAALAYSFKFIWAPIVDNLPVPFLTKYFGRRRSWLLAAQFGVIISIILMSSFDPAAGGERLVFMAWSAALLGFSSATQDIVIDAYRIEVAEPDVQALLSSSYIAGYRLAMVVSGAGALYLADFWGSTKEAYQYEAWKLTYLSMAGVMLVGVSTTLMMREPVLVNQSKVGHSRRQYINFFIFFISCIAALVFCYIRTSDFAALQKRQLGVILNDTVLSSFLVEVLRFFGAVLVVMLVGLGLHRLGVSDRMLLRKNYWEPMADFFDRYGIKLAILLLVFIGFYRVSDIVLGVVVNVFYQDIGFSKSEIAMVAKTFGLVMMIIGGVLGGVLSVRFGVMRMLLVGAILTVMTNLLFVIQVHAGYDIVLLYLVLSADSLTAGLASTAFIAFLSSITNASFTAVQYAIFSSLMTLPPKIIGGYSGSMVLNMGYSNFFLMASFMGVPVFYLIYLLNKHIKLSQ